MSRTTPFAFACLCTLPLAAQDPEGREPRESRERELAARDFFPVDYRSELFVDFGALKDNGIWAAFERSLVAPFFALFHQHYGFALVDLEELRMHFDEGGEPSLLVFRGSEVVGLPPMGLQGRPHEIVKVGDIEVMQDTEDDCCYVSPRPGILVQGSESLVLPVLRGERKGGVPSPELLSLSSGRGNLFYAVLPIPGDALDEMDIPGLPGDWYAADDKPTLIALRWRQTGEGESNQRILLQATVRHENGGTGPARLKALAEQGLEWLSGHPRLGAFKRYWKAVQIETDGRDLVASLDLGSPREAAAVLPLMISPAFLYARAEEAPVAAPAPGPAPPEPEPKKGGDKGKQDGGERRRP